MAITKPNWRMSFLESSVYFLLKAEVPIMFTK